MRLKSLTVRGFRGFNNEETIQLDSNIVVIYGLNGSGKSSFTEALEWLFFGEISRQRLSNCKSEYQYEEYLRNLFYSDVANPFVEVVCTVNGVEKTYRKELSGKTELFFVDGKPISSFDAEGLDLRNCVRPMLAQTEIKALVDSEQKERWEQLANILGQSAFSDLRDNLLLLKKAKRDETYKSHLSTFTSLKRDLELSTSLSKMASHFETGTLQEFLTLVSEYLDTDKTEVSEILAVLAEKIKLLMNSDLGNRVSSVQTESSQKYKEMTQRIISSVQEIHENAITASKGKENHDSLTFLERGLPLVTDETCPFCKEETLSDEKLDSIKGLLSDEKEYIAARQNVVEAKDKVNKGFDAYSKYILETLIPVNELGVIAQKMSDLGQTEIASKLQKAIAKLQEFVSDSKSQIKLGVDSVISDIESKYFHGKEELEIDFSKLDNILKNCSESYVQIANEIDAIKEEMVKLLSTNKGEDEQTQLKDLITLEKTVKFRQDQSFFWTTHNKLKLIDTLEVELKEYEKQQLSVLLKKHAQQIAAYYKRLNEDDEIQFSSIEVKDGVKRQAKLKATGYGKDINPVTIFSEAHTNSLALSIYFPQRVDSNAAWEHIVLDDPVQSMDENHSLSLIDILIDTSKSKQVIVLTHSKSFFQNLKTRFYSDSPLIYNFYYNDESGPKIKLSAGETKDYLAEVETFRSKGDKNSLESGGNSLRKAIESVCIEYLLLKGKAYTTTEKFKNKGLNKLFEQAEIAGMDVKDIGKLKSLLDMSNDSSHAWSIVDTTAGGLKKGIGYIEQVMVDNL